jgi:uracil-DNA glycosylase family 4
VRKFDPNCQRCPRLTANLARVRECHPDYHAAPVAGFGPNDARLLIVGLAPGMHGANRSGRPFTGDASGRLLFEVLFETGFANRPDASGCDDGLALWGCRITNAVKCLPPGNRPVAAEISNCRSYLEAEIAALWRPGVRKPRVLMALGRIAHEAIVAAVQPTVAFRFGHGARYRLQDRLWLLDSYHPSRQNVNTHRLTRQMLVEVFEIARQTLDGSEPPA